MPFLSRVSKTLFRTGALPNWRHHPHTLSLFSCIFTKIAYYDTYRKLFQIKPYVSVRGAHRAKYRRTLARTAHVTCISLVDRSLDQSRKRINHTYEITIKICEHWLRGVSTCNQRRSATIDGSRSAVHLHSRTSTLIGNFSASRIEAGYPECPSPESESVAVAAMVILHLAVASAGGRAASTRRK